jgi:hypothetical protein
MIRSCAFCGKSFTAKRSDAKFHSDACRMLAYRRRHGAGSAERKQRQREGQRLGLNKKYAGRQLQQAKRDIHRYLLRSPTDLDGWPWFGTDEAHELGERLRQVHGRTPPSAAVRAELRLMAMNRRESDPDLSLWLASDSFSRQEVYIAFGFDRSSRLAQYRTLYPLPPGIRAEPATKSFPIIKGMDRIRVIQRPKWWQALVRQLPPVPLEFTCRLCGGTVSRNRLASHDCRANNPLGFRLDLAVTLTYLDREEELDLAA